MVQTDIRILVPRVRRKLEGAGSPPVLTEDQIKDMVADALANILLYTGSVFGKTLDVTARDGNGVPTDYATSDLLTLPEGEVVAAQAALDYYFFRFSGYKTSERIADEAGQWEYTISASVVKAQLDLLVAERDRALEAVSQRIPMESYVSFLQVRDQTTSALVEPWVDGNTGLIPAMIFDPDFRFGGI